MYYEYHLEDGSIRYSKYANINEFIVGTEPCFCDCCGHLLGEDDIVLSVKYCVIKEGEYCDQCESVDCECEEYDPFEAEMRSL